jgi:hypothetical protein
VAVLISATLSTATANPAFGVAADGRGYVDDHDHGAVDQQRAGVGHDRRRSRRPAAATRSCTRDAHERQRDVTTGTIRSTVAETKTITVTVNPGPSQIVLTMQPTVTFVATSSRSSTCA